MEFSICTSTIKDCYILLFCHLQVRDQQTKKKMQEKMKLTGLCLENLGTVDLFISVEFNFCVLLLNGKLVYRLNLYRCFTVGKLQKCT